MAIAAGPPSQLNPGEVRSFGVPTIVTPFARNTGVGYDVLAKVDPSNFILESNEDNNVGNHFFNSQLCQ
jgi:subtilase family serine protease